MIDFTRLPGVLAILCISLLTALCHILTNLKYKYGNRHFWCRGYYVDSVGKYENAIKEYIRNQLQEDRMMDTLDFKETKDPFTGE